MHSIVAHEKVKGNNKQAVLNAVKKAMRNAQWTKFVHGKKIFIKINLLSHQVVPGHCTSPWVLEAVLQEIKQLGAKVCVGDADVATVQQVELAAKNWDVLELCEKYGARFVNLSKCRTTTVSLKGKIFDKLQVPQPIAQADSIITIPVLKTHSLSTMTCSLKNQWGCLPRYRQIYHDRLHDAIAEMNLGIKVNFAVCDATVCSEGAGPRNGTPKIVNSILAAADRVALDSAAAEIIGIKAEEVLHIKKSEQLRLGSMNYQIIGEGIVSQNFKLPNLDKMFIIKWEMRLRQVPLLKTILFKTPLFKIFAWIATQYNAFWWYHTAGKNAAKKFVEENSLYAQEFKKLINL